MQITDFAKRSTKHVPIPQPGSIIETATAFLLFLAPIIIMFVLAAK